MVIVKVAVPPWVTVLELGVADTEKSPTGSGFQIEDEALCAGSDALFCGNISGADKRFERWSDARENGDM